MKKLLLAAVMLVSASAFAQTKIGLKAGVNFANQEWEAEGISISPNANTSFHLFGFADVPVSERFSIQPGLGISGKGFKVEGQGTANAMYLEIPINAVAKFNAGSIGKFFVGAGPYAAVGIAGKVKADGEEMDYFGDDSDAKRGDFGLNFLGGLELSNGLLFNLNYGLGLANIAKSSGEEDIDYTMKNKVFSISVGFAF